MSLGDRITAVEITKDPVRRARRGPGGPTPNHVLDLPVPRMSEAGL